jgi:hypothetical protein
VIFDIKTKRDPDRMPVLLDRDAGQIVGSVSFVKIGTTPKAEGFAADMDAGANVASRADKAFPWQMSVRVMPETMIRPGVTRRRCGATGVPRKTRRRSPGTAGSARRASASVAPICEAKRA